MKDFSGGTTATVMGLNIVARYRLEKGQLGEVTETASNSTKLPFHCRPKSPNQ